MPKTKKPVTRNKKTSKKSSVKRSFSLSSRLGQFIAFIFIFAVLGGGYFLYKSFAATACRQQNLQSGSDKTCVKQLQHAINVNQPGRLVEDGIYGSKTIAAVQDIQRFWSLSVDGIAGPKTAEAFCYGLALNGKSAEYCNTVAPPPPAPKVSAPTVPNIQNQTNFQSNVNTQVTNTGGQTKVGNNSTTTKNVTQTTTAPVPAQPAVVDPAVAAQQEAIKQAITDSIMKQIAAAQQGGGSTQAGNINSSNVVITNVNTNSSNTGGQVIVNNNSGGCGTVTLNDPFSGVSKTYNTCNTQNPVSSGPAISIPQNTTASPVNPSAPQPDLSSNKCPSRTTVQTGSKGDCVKRVQDLLNIKQGAGLAVDGDFGPKTKAAVINYQTAHGLKADGIVGNQTWSSLEGDTSLKPVGTTTPSGSTGGSQTAPAPKAPAAPTGTNCRQKLVDQNRSNDAECVKIVQRKVGANPDGIFGPDTAKKVIAFKTAHGIPTCNLSSIGPDQWPYILGEKTNGPGCGTNTGLGTPVNDPKLSSPVTQPAGGKPSEYHHENSDQKTYTFPSDPADRHHTAQICVSIAPTSKNANKSIPDAVHTKGSNLLINLKSTTINGFKAKAGCTYETFSGKQTSVKYTVEVSGYWVNVYGDAIRAN